MGFPPLTALRFVPLPPPAATAKLESGEPAYRAANLAMFVGGFATFAMLYATQPLLPLFSAEFGVSPARASLSVSLGTGALALMLIPASVLTDRIGRIKVMKASLVLASIIAIASAAVGSFDQLLWLRGLLGLALAGLPAAAMAYLGEEVGGHSQGKAMGLYIAGNALGGMSGRFVAALLTDWGGWRIALLTLGVFGLIAALVFWRKLPPSRHFRARAAAPARILADARAIFADRGLPSLFLIAILGMGAFISVYNYLGFRLQAPPFALGHAAIGAVFLLYLIGSWASALAGQLADRHGRHRVHWIMVLIMGAGLLLTMADALVVVIGGVGVLTFGFFATHSIASGWVAQRAHERRGLATAIYLSCYYLGASVLGSLSGLAWSKGGWNGLAAALALCILALLAITLHMRALPPDKA